MFSCCLVSSLSPMIFYNILLPMFSAGRSPASLLLVCVPPRPTAAWLLLPSVVPYHSLFLLLLLCPGHQVRLLFFYSKFALSWLPISRSAKSFSDRLFLRPGIRFPVPFSRSAASFSDRLF